jgi:hypothetical protein
MRPPALTKCALFVISALLPLYGAPVPACDAAARTFLPCELSFPPAVHAGAASSPFANDLLRVEFRSPAHKTYLMHAFFDGSFRVRFSPTEPGTWTYRVLSDIQEYNDKETTFNVADSGLPGMVDVANLRHWRTTNKQPHLWLAAEAPFLSVGQPAWEAWLDARKHDGFTHVRGVVLTNDGSTKPFSANDNLPQPAYFSALDDRVLAAASRGFTLDLVLADRSATPLLQANFEQLEAVTRYVAARYGGLNVTWQSLEYFEDTPGARELLKNIGMLIAKYDGFAHPRSTGAHNSTFPLLSDGWLNYGMEGSPDPQLGAVEHQFTELPEIHLVHASEPDAFRRELWNATTNGEYPSIPYEASKNEADMRAIRTWTHVIAGTRHWELEPYFGVDGARAIGLNEVEYLAYAAQPGVIEITLPKHKYNPVWVNPATGEELELKDYKGQVFGQQTPGNRQDWILAVPREGKKANMLKYYYFESESAPVQEIETEPSRTPFQITDPAGDSLSASLPTPYGIKITRANRASRHMQYVWWGEGVAGGEGARLLGLGASGSFSIPPALLNQSASTLNVRLLAINANGKAYEVDRVYQITQ